MNTPHKHAALIKQWADGAQIQYKHTGPPPQGEWADVKQPTWRSDCDYRVKPEIKPDVMFTYYANGPENWVYRSHHRGPTGNLRLTFDGDTLKLKKAEVI